jgi:cell division protein FtsI (penicillin-binding protein 3)
LSRVGKPGSRPTAGRQRRGTRAVTQATPVGQGRAANARRVRTVTEPGPDSASFVYRYRVGNVVILLALLVAAAQLFNLQVPSAAGLRAQAAGQLKVTDAEKAVRGAIVDRNFDKLAFTTEARALTFQPA